MVIRGERVWLGGQFVKASLKIENGKILKVGRYEDGEQWAKKEGLIDCGRDRLIPGLIDIHTHGAFGFDTDDGLRDGLRQWAGKLPLEGVTAFLPTTAAQTPAVLKTALENVSAGIRAQEKEKRSPAWPGAQILGVHMEGPFLSRDYAGAQAGNSIALPSIEQFQEYQKAAGGRIRCLTLAPEEDGDFALTRYCSESGVVVSMGHSAADYETALLATANGASSMTHVFNAMTGFHHRRPGLAGAALRIPNLYGEIICDGLHCHPSVLNVFFAAKGKNFGIMVTETVVLLTQKRKSKDYKVEIEIPIDVDGSKTYTEEKSTYQNIKKFIKAKYGVNTHTKDIAEVKRDCGVGMRLNYNISKKENPKIRHCTQEKRGYIVDALEYYQVI